MLKYFFPFLFIALFVSCKEKHEAQLSVCFTGDVLLDRGVREQIEKENVEALFKNVKPLFLKSDAVVVNFECPATAQFTPMNRKYIFRANPEWLPALKQCGITHAAMANNHTMDQGRNGITETYQNLIASGITPLGYGSNQKEAIKPVFIEKNGIRIALFNSLMLPVENWMYLEDQPGICQATIDTLSEAIRLLKVKEPETFIVPVLHWGMEFQQTASFTQRREAYQLIDNGADAIIGHHPHVIQKEEFYKGKPIFYSLGNFVFDQKNPVASKGEIVNLTFNKTEITFKKYFVEIKNCKPIVIR